MARSLKCLTIERGLIVPIGEIELYLLLGWSLADEPTCSGARMESDAELIDLARSV